MSEIDEVIIEFVIHLIPIVDLRIVIYLLLIDIRVVVKGLVYPLVVICNQELVLVLEVTLTVIPLRPGLGSEKIRETRIDDHDLVLKGVIGYPHRIIPH